MRNLMLKAMFLVAAVAALPAPLQAAGSAPEVKYAVVGDIRIAYYTRGQGSPLVMINGYMSSMSLWDPALLDVLDDEHTLILFDNRGVGLSTDTGEDNTSMAQMADDTAGLITALGYARADVLGFSMGARIAQQVFIRHPDLVGKGILAAPNPGGSRQIKPSAEVETKLNDPAVSTVDKAQLFFPDDPAGRLALQEVRDRVNEAIKSGSAPDDLQVSSQTALRQNRARTTLWNADESNFNALKTITFPVLISDGRDDMVDVPANASLIASQIPFAWLTFYDGGHAFLYQSYEKFGATVTLFLK
jgi:pimeloyl-ACP methyl ester carboxylesterase